MTKLETIENQLTEALSDLREINDDRCQLVFDYVEHSLHLAKQLNIKEIPSKAYRAVSDGFDVIILAESLDIAQTKLEKTTFGICEITDKKPVTVIL